VRARLLRFLADLRYVTGLGYEDGIKALEEGLRIYEELGDETRAAQMHTRLGRAYGSFQQWMDVPRATDDYRKAERVLSRGDPGPALGYVYVGLAGTSLWGIHTDEGLETSAKAMEIGERLGHEILWANAAALHGWHTWAAGRPAEGQALLERAYEVTDRLEHGPASFFVAWMRGFSSQMLGDPHDGKWWFQRELAKPRIAQAPGLRSQLLEGVAQATFFAGEPAERADAVAELADDGGSMSRFDGAYLFGDLTELDAIRKAPLQSGRERGVTHMYGYYLSAHGLLAEVGDYEGEIARSREVLADISGHLPWELWQRCYLVESFVALGRIAEAREEVERIRKIRGSGEGWRGIDSYIDRAAGALAAGEGDLAAANGHFTRAIDTARRFGHGFNEGRVLQAWGRALAAAGAGREANEKFDELVDVWRRCGRGRPWFERLAAERNL
jgi:tetratricopeptide (TPR) repeat protein